MSSVKLDPFTDPAMHSFIENNIRGGVSAVSNRYAKANNSYTGDGLDETQHPSYVCYLDANNLCGYAMSQPQPTSNFRFVRENEIRYLDITNIPDDELRTTKPWHAVCLASGMLAVSAARPCPKVWLIGRTAP